MCLSIFSALESPRAFSSRIAFAVEGGIFFNSGLTYRFFGFDLALEAVFALDGKSMTSLFLDGGSTSGKSVSPTTLRKHKLLCLVSKTEHSRSCFAPLNHPVNTVCPVSHLRVKPLYYVGRLSPVAKILTMPKRQDDADELAAFRARWLYLADAALSASEKTIQALELAKEEQQRIRKQLKGNIEKYQRLERRKAKKA